MGMGPWRRRRGMAVGMGQVRRSLILSAFALGFGLGLGLGLGLRLHVGRCEWLKGGRGRGVAGREVMHSLTTKYRAPCSYQATRAGAEEV